MPEVTFTVELPDGTNHYCYSPSTVVKSYFEKDQTLTAAEFIDNSRNALTEASERVRQKFGFSCIAASASLHDIETWAGKLDPEDEVKIVHI